MGYLVESSGRLGLSESDDAAAVAAVKAAWAERDGWFNPSMEAFLPCDTLADIAHFAAASITRDGAWIEFIRSKGDGKWSGQATAFYVAIAPFVRSGVVHIQGEDDARWSYTYADGQIAQQGWNGWDGSIEPFGEYVGANPQMSAVGYTVEPSGRLNLSESDDAAAVAAVKTAGG
ncbi:hypothetical protein Ais01nite_74960 [Asanoa ishikariensis]|uniref:hypothetical protein n=1 Tax=Asanoa ishikariensis TaxID=137265 RepID=UPI0015A13E9D|nr:hypothetical protein [Asanoa ishikariensis]GIF69461.1 hypothetical protein Ais01nite_74960 [Asanoa ishikariensis]